MKNIVPRSLMRLFRRIRVFVAKCIYGFPHRKLTIIGVTGTDGKTTVVNLVGHILKTTGIRVGWISTLGAQVHTSGYEIPQHTTTVGAFTFYKFLRFMVREKVEMVVVELTSHALAQERVGTLQLTGAVVTNITHEHQDYHHTMEEYIEAKMKIFDLVNRGMKFGGAGTVALNCNDNAFFQLAQAARLKRLRVVSFGTACGEVRGERFEETLDGMGLSIIAPGGRHTITTRLLGDYNLHNILAACAIAHAVRVPWEKIHEGIETFQPLPGRLEPVMHGQPYRVYVDFAHTPHALREVLTLLKRHATGKLMIVFGATGERDRSKRPLMGEAVGALADFAFVTEEDPRTERVDDISEAIAQGLDRTGKKRGQNYWLINDRREAIRAAFEVAHSGDIVLIAGKGHERTMARAGGIDEPWDDRVVAAEELERRGWRRDGMT